MEWIAQNLNTDILLGAALGAIGLGVVIFVFGDLQKIEKKIAVAALPVGCILLVASAMA
jgi:hypothetical protein